MNYDKFIQLLSTFSGELWPLCAVEDSDILNERYYAFMNILCKVYKYTIYNKEKYIVDTLYEKVFASRGVDGQTFTDLINYISEEDSEYLEDICVNGYHGMATEYCKKNSPCYIGDCVSLDEVESLMCTYHNISDKEIEKYNEHIIISEELRKTRYLLSAENRLKINFDKEKQQFELDKQQFELEKQQLKKEKETIQEMNVYYKEKNDAKKGKLLTYKNSLQKFAMDLSENNDFHISNQLINTELFTIINELNHFEMI